MRTKKADYDRARRIHHYLKSDHKSKKNKKSCSIIWSSSSVLLSMLFLLHWCYQTVERAQHGLNKFFFSEVLYTYTSGMEFPETCGFSIFLPIRSLKTTLPSCNLKPLSICCGVFLQDLFLNIFSIFILESLTVCGWIYSLWCSFDRIIQQSYLMFLYRESQKSTWISQCIHCLSNYMWQDTYEEWIRSVLFCYFSKMEVYPVLWLHLL